MASLTVNGTEFTQFTEAAEREQRVELSVLSLYGAGAELPFHIDGGEITDVLPGADATAAGRLVHRWGALDGVLRVQGERVAGPYQPLRLRLRVENATQPEMSLRTREDGLRFALIAAHSVIGLADGMFISMTDHPEWATAEVAACTNTGTWPVLAGPDECRNLVLSSPIILYDHPQIAPESAGDLFDATEIDEILTLRTMALTDEEKREARATDPRAADLIDRLDGLPPEMMERLHGAIRYLESGVGPVLASPGQPGPGPDAAESPGTPAGPAGPRLTEAGPAGPRLTEAGPAGPRPTEAGPAGPRPTEAGPAGPRPTEAGPAGPRPTEAGPAGPRPTEAGPAGPRPTEAGPAGPRPTEAGPAGPRPTEAGPAGPRLTEAGPFPGAAAADDIPVFHTPAAPWWDPGADTSVSPETDHVMIGGVRIAQGAVVRMKPGARRADAQDLFLIGREAVVEAVLHDVDGQVHVAVLPLSDPTMAELQRAQGRFLYFGPDELEPVRAARPELTSVHS